MSNLVTRLPVQSRRSNVVIPITELSPLVNYDPDSTAFWSLYQQVLSSKTGAYSLTAMDPTNAPPVFTPGKGLIVNGVYQDAYAIHKPTAEYLTDTDLPDGVTLCAVFLYDPMANPTGNINRILFGNLQGQNYGLAITTFNDSPAYSVAQEKARFPMGTTKLTAGWCFAALSYNRSTRHLAVLWKQLSSGISLTDEFTGTDSTPYVPLPTIGYVVGNGSFGEGGSDRKENITVAEFAVYNKGMGLSDLVAKYTDARVRMNAVGITV
ncbi:hypothetical protein [Klebsiella pneumoniae]|uniref:hypothetical protein n=1 Tax=Klebsiella pneumoniae TaxID=573 RepID=UPI0010916C83|nr:hypothetical protein [Klebsiella pneumoniae]VGD57632.1 Uncharacterised protein [Klebsiella pneumoniae]